MTWMPTMHPHLVVLCCLLYLVVLVYILDIYINVSMYLSYSLYYHHILCVISVISTPYCVILSAIFVSCDMHVLSYFCVMMCLFSVIKHIYLVVFIYTIIIPPLYPIFIVPCSLKHLCHCISVSICVCFVSWCVSFVLIHGYILLHSHISLLYHQESAISFHPVASTICVIALVCHTMSIHGYIMLYVHLSLLFHQYTPISLHHIAPTICIVALWWHIGCGRVTWELTWYGRHIISSIIQSYGWPYITQLYAYSTHFFVANDVLFHSTL